MQEPVGRLTNAISRFNVGLGSASGLSTMLLILIIVPDVIARKFLGFTIPFASEMAVFLLVCKIFLGLPGAQASKANFHVTLISGRLPARAARILKIVTLTLSLVLIAMLGWYATHEAVRSTGAGEAVYVGANQFPVWPQRIVVSIGLVLLGVQLLVDLVRAAAGLPEAEVKRETLDLVKEAP